jgi:hypothetical protein
MAVQNSLKLDGVTEVYPGFTTTPGGGKTFLVHSSGAAALSDLPAGFAGNPDGFFQSVGAALNACRSARGDKVIMLPGHVESVSTANFWASIGTTSTCSDVEIVGCGTGSNRPTFTWTTATSTILFNSANIKLRNCRLFLAGAHAAGSALTVAAPITATADGCEITDCEIAYGFQANRIVGIGITTTAAATRLNFSRNDVYAETIAVPTTTFLRLTGTDFFRMDDTRIIGPGSSTTIGPVQFLTTAPLKLNWNRSSIISTTAVATVCVAGIAGTTGNINGCYFGIASGTTPWSNPPLNIIGCFQNNGTPPSVLL